MGILRDTIGANGRRRAEGTSGIPGASDSVSPGASGADIPGADASEAAQAFGGQGATGTPGGPASPRPSSALERRREALAREVAELHWDLGGLTYEMAIRDHFRLDVLVRRAAVLQERDAELAEVERLLASHESGAPGSCPHCGAPHSRGALFCWECGGRVMEELPSASLGAGTEADAGTDADGAQTPL